MGIYRTRSRPRIVSPLLAECGSSKSAILDFLHVQGAFDRTSQNAFRNSLFFRTKFLLRKDKKDPVSIITMSKAQTYREKSFCSGNTGIDENHYKTRPLGKE